MKISFKNRNLKERYSDWYGDYCIRRNQRLIEKSVALHDWHKKFAWRPMIVKTEKRTQIVWLENIYRKVWSTVESSGELVWWKHIKFTKQERRTKGEHFKTKLTNGESGSGVSGETQMDTSTA